LGGYDRKCRCLSQKEIESNLKSKVPYVIRQKMPTTGETEFFDAVYGNIKVKNSELDDQILIKTDGFPTYNFANVVDDHQMQITHVVRGCEYLISTPKYNLLYKAFGWEVPEYIHLPLIMGQNEDGSVSKLSKRHGATGFYDLIKQGYLPEAITNYIALLGWCPKDTQEMFSLEELKKSFSIEGISKSPSIFDYDKLNWFNAEYLKNKTDEEFLTLCIPYLKDIFKNPNTDYSIIISMLKPRLTKLTQIGDLLSFFTELPKYDTSLFENKKSKSTIKSSQKMLDAALEILQKIDDWSFNNIHDIIINLASELGVKNGTLMWPIRIAISGTLVTPGGCIEILALLGKQESIRRIKTSRNLII
jgi:glutamyl-tRNA synthetase